MIPVMHFTARFSIRMRIDGQLQQVSYMEGKLKN